MTRIPRFRFQDRPKPNPIRIQNVFVDPPIVPLFYFVVSFSISTAVPLALDYYDDDQSYVPSYYAPTYEPPPLYYDEPQSLEVFETLPAETSLIDPNLQCYERTCDQNITGKIEYLIN